MSQTFNEPFKIAAHVLPVEAEPINSLIGPTVNQSNGRLRQFILFADEHGTFEDLADLIDKGYKARYIHPHQLSSFAIKVLQDEKGNDLALHFKIREIFPTGSGPHIVKVVQQTLHRDSSVPAESDLRRRRPALIGSTAQVPQVTLTRAATPAPLCSRPQSTQQRPNPNSHVDLGNTISCPEIDSDETEDEEIPKSNDHQVLPAVEKSHNIQSSQTNVGTFLKPALPAKARARAVAYVPEQGPDTESVRLRNLRNPYSVESDDPVEQCQTTTATEKPSTRHSDVFEVPDTDDEACKNIDETKHERLVHCLQPKGVSVHKSKPEDPKSNATVAHGNASGVGDRSEERHRPTMYMSGALTTPLLALKEEVNNNVPANIMEKQITGNLRGPSSVETEPTPKDSAASLECANINDDSTPNKNSEAIRSKRFSKAAQNSLDPQSSKVSKFSDKMRLSKMQRPDENAKPAPIKKVSAKICSDANNGSHALQKQPLVTGEKRSKENEDRNLPEEPSLAVPTSSSNTISSTPNNSAEPLLSNSTRLTHRNKAPAASKADNTNGLSSGVSINDYNKPKRQGQTSQGIISAAANPVLDPERLEDLRACKEKTDKYFAELATKEPHLLTPIEKAQQQAHNIYEELLSMPNSGVKRGQCSPGHFGSESRSSKRVKGPIGEKMVPTKYANGVGTYSKELVLNNTASEISDGTRQKDARALNVEIPSNSARHFAKPQSVKLKAALQANSKTPLSTKKSKKECESHTTSLASPKHDAFGKTPNRARGHANETPSSSNKVEGRNGGAPTPACQEIILISDSDEPKGAASNNKHISDSTPNTTQLRDEKIAGTMFSVQEDQVDKYGRKLYLPFPEFPRPKHRAPSLLIITDEEKKKMIESRRIIRHPLDKPGHGRPLGTPWNLNTMKPFTPQWYFDEWKKIQEEQAKLLSPIERDIPPRDMISIEDDSRHKPLGSSNKPKSGQPVPNARRKAKARARQRDTSSDAESSVAAERKSSGMSSGKARASPYSNSSKAVTAKSTTLQRSSSSSLRSIKPSTRPQANAAKPAATSSRGAQNKKVCGSLADKSMKKQQKHSSGAPTTRSVATQTEESSGVLFTKASANALGGPHAQAAIKSEDAPLIWFRTDPRPEEHVGHITESKTVVQSSHFDQPEVEFRTPPQSPGVAQPEDVFSTPPETPQSWEVADQSLNNKAATVPRAAETSKIPRLIGPPTEMSEVSGTAQNDPVTKDAAAAKDEQAFEPTSHPSKGKRKAPAESITVASKAPKISTSSGNNPPAIKHDTPSVSKPAVSNMITSRNDRHASTQKSLAGSSVEAKGARTSSIKTTSAAERKVPAKSTAAALGSSPLKGETTPSRLKAPRKPTSLARGINPKTPGKGVTISTPSKGTNQINPDDGNNSDSSSSSSESESSSSSSESDLSSVSEHPTDILSDDDLNEIAAKKTARKKRNLRIHKIKLLREMRGPLNTNSGAVFRVRGGPEGFAKRAKWAARELAADQKAKEEAAIAARETQVALEGGCC